ncbi:MAG: thioredoxin family protein [Deltaproteobacteria bacterium]|nr:thioredoxin family protein [Deltaproteobacteria bacterium]
MALITKNPCKLKFGDSAPDFSLPGVDDKTYSLASFKDKKILVVMFTCNHCPYVQAYEERIIAVQRDYTTKGVQLVAINANETKNYPEDNFENMVIRTKEKRYNFPYLRDETQKTAKAYDAACTPEIYAFDEKRLLRFHGRLDDNYEEPEKVTKQFLRQALDEMLTGKPVSIPESHPIGCSIKWEG